MTQSGIWRSQQRKRGVILTAKGLRKLKAGKFALEMMDNYSNPYTFEQLSERTGLDQRTVARILGCQVGVDLRSLKKLFDAFKQKLEVDDYVSAAALKQTKDEYLDRSVNSIYIEWRDEIDVSLFFGRTEEFSQLKQWILVERCRLIALMGMGGIGKTSLCVKLMQQVASQFEFAIWKSLHHAPPLPNFLAELLSWFSKATKTPTQQGEANQITQLLNYLNKHRCLLILDNGESVLESNHYSGCYRPGYTAYGELLQRIAQTHHQSCVLFVSREKPQEVSIAEGSVFPVRSFRLEGLQVTDARALLEARGQFTGIETDWKALIHHYDGNPLALKMMASVVLECLDGNLSKLTHYLRHEYLIVDDICNLLKQQFERLTPLEQQIMIWLAVNSTWTSLEKLYQAITPAITMSALLTAICSLRRRCLIEKQVVTSSKKEQPKVVCLPYYQDLQDDAIARKQVCFSLKPLLMGFVSNLLSQQLCTELKDLFALADLKTCINCPSFKNSVLNLYALVDPTTPSSIRKMQQQFLVKPTIDQLVGHFGNKQQLIHWFAQFHEMLNEIEFSIAGYASQNLEILMFCLQSQQQNIASADEMFGLINSKISYSVS